VVDLSGPPGDGERPAPARVAFTSGRPPSAALGAALARFGIGWSS
jgi:hypothetical protein